MSPISHETDWTNIHKSQLAYCEMTLSPYIQSIYCMARNIWIMFTQSKLIKMSNVVYFNTLAMTYMNQKLLSHIKYRIWNTLHYLSQSDLSPLTTLPQPARSTYLLWAPDINSCIVLGPRLQNNFLCVAHNTHTG